MVLKIPTQEDMLLRNFQGCLSTTNDDLQSSDFPSIRIVKVADQLTCKWAQNPLTAGRQRDSQTQPRDHIRASDAFCS